MGAAVVAFGARQVIGTEAFVPDVAINLGRIG